jgi:AraC family transcriptional regulator
VIEQQLLPSPLWVEPRARLGLRVDLQTTAPGLIQLDALPDHRLKIHAGDPVHGACRSERFRYTRGDVDIFPAGMSDVWQVQETETALILHLPSTLLRRAAQEIGLDPDRAGLDPRHQIRDPQIEHIAWALDAERRAGNPAGLLYTESLGLALAIHLLGRYPAPLSPGSGLSRRQLERLTSYIDAHLDADLSLAHLSAVANLSASHLKTLFKRSTGLPVHEYVVQRRVERARELLLRGELPISQVALEVGFAHQSHLARWMRRILGVTPTTIARGSRAH